MKEQNSEHKIPYSVDDRNNKLPFFVMHNKRVTNLQSKVNFYEGQIDPIHQENLCVKDHLSKISKMLSCSTQILRNLLPAHNSAMKLKIEMANIEELALMIQDQWRDMEKTIVDLNQQLILLQKVKNDIIANFQQQIVQKNEQYDKLEQSKYQMKAQFQNKIDTLQSELKKQILERREERKKLESDATLKEQFYASSFQQFQLCRIQYKIRQEELEKCITRLRAEIQGNFLQFQQGKKQIKSLYQKIMNEKLAEQSEMYQAMIKMKEQEKYNLACQMSRRQQDEAERQKEKQKEMNKKIEQIRGFKENIQQLKEQIRQKKLTIDEARNSYRTLDEENAKLVQNCKSYLKKIEIKNEQLYQMNKNNKQAKHILQKQIQILKQNEVLTGNKLKQKIYTLQKQLKNYKQQLQTANVYLKDVEVIWNKKIDKMKQIWFQKETIMNEEMLKKDRMLQQEQIKFQKLQKHNQQEIRIIKASHKQKIQSLQLNNRLTKEQLIKQFTKKIKKMQSDIEDEGIKNRLNFQKQLALINQKSNQEIKKIQEGFKRQLIEQQNKFINQRKENEAQLMLIKNQSVLMKEKLSKNEKKMNQHQRQVDKLKTDQFKAIKRMEQLNQSEKKSLNDRIEMQMEDFQKVIQQKQKQIFSIKVEMQNQIRMLKQSTAIQGIQDKFQAQIRSLKLQFSSKYRQIEQQNQRQIKKINEQSKKHIQTLINANKLQKEQLSNVFNNQMKNIKCDFQKLLTQIALKIENKDTFLNDRILNGILTGELNELTQQQKLQYIYNKINEEKDKNIKRSQIIIELQLQLQNKNKQIQLMEHTIEQRVKNKRAELQKQKQIVIKDCKLKVEAITSQCNIKISLVQKDRIRHSQQIYQQFIKIKEQNQKEYLLLLKKYNELQKIFAERPSRMEDVTRIKELMNLHTKLDTQMKTYHKKMEKANQIVKYLNLQLENYKDAYDIFGPNNEQSTISPNKTTTNFNQNSQVTVDIKNPRLQKPKDEKNISVKDFFPFSSVNLGNQSPPIKQLKVFGQNLATETFVMQSKQISEQRQRKYSYVPEKSSLKKQKTKTQKTQKFDKQVQIMQNAQIFLKLMKGSKPDIVIKQDQRQDYNKKKSYRRRKVIKRVTTIDTQHYI